jgi:DNA-binding MurR/RpiR family transcriptional regulator
MPTAIAHTVEASFAALTPTAKRIASYMPANLERLGLATADQSAQQTGTSGISVERFLHSVGHRVLDELKRDFRCAQTWPRCLADRLDARRNERLDRYAHGVEDMGDTALPHSLDLDAIRYVYPLARGDTFARVAQRNAAANVVFPGIQPTRAISNTFYRYLKSNGSAPLSTDVSRATASCNANSINSIFDNDDR